MGIDKLFSKLRMFVNNNTNPSQEETKQEKIKCRQLYFDFNSLVYETINILEKNIQYVQYSYSIGKLDQKSYSIIRDILSDSSFADNNLFFNILFDPTQKDVTDPDKVKLENIDIHILYGHFNDKIYNLSNNYIINKINNYICNLIELSIDHSNLEKIFISFDGIANFAKLIEQKKRKIMRYILTGLKKKFENENKEVIGEKRFKYMKNKFYFDKTKLGLEGKLFSALVDYYTHNTNVNQNIPIGSNRFFHFMIKKYPSIKEIKVSPITEPGEGENKIMNDILTSNYESCDCVIISPDSDMVILGMLTRNILFRSSELATETKTRQSKYGSHRKYNTRSRHPNRKNTKEEKSYNIHVIKGNTKTISVISINDFCKAIYKYIQSRSSLILSEQRVINDIVFIFTIFGNDYVPCIEAINVSNDIEIIFNIYIHTLLACHNTHKLGTYLTYHCYDNKYKINYDIFAIFIHILADCEMYFVKDKYMCNTYRNYKLYKKIFNDVFVKPNELNNPLDYLLYPRLTQYTPIANMLYTYVSSFDQKLPQGVDIAFLSKLSVEKIKEHVDASVDSLIIDLKSLVKLNRIYPNIYFSANDYTKYLINAEVVKKRASSNNFSNSHVIHILTKFMKLFIKIECDGMINNKEYIIDHTEKNNIDHTEKYDTEDNLKVIITDIVVTMIKKRYYAPNMVFYHDLVNVKNDYHQDKIRREISHQNMEVTHYDEERYKFMRCTGKYKTHFLPEYKYGSFSLSHNKQLYKYTHSNILTDNQEYYIRFFGFDVTHYLHDVSVENNKKIREIVQEYIKGFFWVFNNNMVNPNEKEKEKTNVWFYKYSHAPLLYHVSKYIKHKTKVNGGSTSWMDSIYMSVKNKTVNQSDFMKFGESSTISYRNFASLNLSSQIMPDDNISNSYPIIPQITDINNIVNDIWNGNKNIIDVHNKYLTNAKLINHELPTYDEWKEQITKPDKTNYRLF